MEKIIFELWPVPAGHKVQRTTGGMKEAKKEVSVLHLLEADLIKVGQVIYPKQGKYAGRNGVIEESGNICIDEKLFETPSGAGVYLQGRATNGWGFWLVNPESKQSLRDIRQEYLEGLGADVEVDDDDDDDDDS